MSDCEAPAADSADPPSPVRTALLSVSDKSGLTDLASALHGLGVRLVSTGGTRRHLEQVGLPTVSVEDVTGFPEMMDGRVKTLHPRIHGGLLARREHPDHAAALETHGITPIDLVCVNLYPFERTVADPAVSTEDAVEQIDIGGPSMVRSAAKNHRHVVIVTDPAQYAEVAAELEANAGGTTLALRRRLAAAAFARTAAYDAAIAAWTASRFAAEPD